MHFTVAQEVKLLAMRHIFITQLGLITQRRQQLAQQLQNGPNAVGISKEEMLHCRFAVDACLQQMHECQALEHKLWGQYMIAICHGVRNRFCLLYWRVPLAFETGKSIIDDRMVRVLS